MSIMACVGLSCSRLDNGEAPRPDPPGDIVVNASSDPPAIIERGTATLSAEVQGTFPSVTFRWEQNGGPMEISLSDDRARVTTTSAFEEPGLYVFRVVATSSNGETGQDYVEIEVASAVTVALRTDNSEIFVGESAQLRALVEGGTPPFNYAWTRLRGPEDVDLSDETEPEIFTPPLLTAGEYEFRVTVTDDNGFTAADTVDVTVQEAFELVVPKLITVGEPVEISVVILADYEGAEYLWETLTGVAILEIPTQPTAILTATAGSTIKLKLTVTLPGDSDGPVEIIRESETVAIEDDRPRVLIETDFGDITLELQADVSPNYTANFLAYVDEGFYDGLLFNRISCNNNDENECDPFVLQGGGFERIDDALELKEPTRDTVPSEGDNGLSNGTLYSVAMALSGGDPDSAQTQFFINLDNNAFLDSQGFSVFAFVIAGRDVVDEIVTQPREQSEVISGELSQPVEDVIIRSIRRVMP